VGVNIIDSKKVDTVSILGFYVFSGSDPLPKRTSGKGPKDQDYRLSFKKIIKSISFEGLA